MTTTCNADVQTETIDVAELIKPCGRIEHVGLSPQEAKALLAELQRQVVSRQMQADARAPSPQERVARQRRGNAEVQSDHRTQRETIRDAPDPERRLKHCDAGREEEYARREPQARRVAGNLLRVLFRVIHPIGFRRG